jgi:hypothetical protein
VEREGEEGREKRGGKRERERERERGGDRVDLAHGHTQLILILILIILLIILFLLLILFLLPPPLSSSSSSSSPSSSSSFLLPPSSLSLSLSLFLPTFSLVCSIITLATRSAYRIQNSGCLPQMQPSRQNNRQTNQPSAMSPYSSLSPLARPILIAQPLISSLPASAPLRLRLPHQWTGAGPVSSRDPRRGLLGTKSQRPHNPVSGVCKTGNSSSSLGSQNRSSSTEPFSCCYCCTLKATGPPSLPCARSLLLPCARPSCVQPASAKLLP